MMLPLALFVVVCIIEILMWVVPLLNVVRAVAGITFIGLVVATVLLSLSQPGLLTLLISIISLYRLANLLRVVKARMNEQYLRKVGLRASLWLVGLQLALLSAWQLFLQQASAYDLWLVTLRLAFLASLIMLVSIVWNLMKTAPPKLEAHGLPDGSLPTLTVAIPARNETDDLEACLTSLVASNYPKLEILVLDDCSQLKRTPEIIREYAHAGVRFLQGKLPGDDWLAKNFAYEQLYKEANGDLILFCGVDVRFEPNSLKLVVAAMQQKKKTMLCLIPRNLVPSPFSVRSSTLIQSMRYAWELALPRRIVNRPPVLSTCWLIKRVVLKDAGGFAAVNRTIVPEAYFARLAAKQDGYTFMQSSSQIGVSSNKSLTDQMDTTVRVKYPQLHKRIELVMLMTLGELAMTVLPAVILVLALAGVLVRDWLMLLSLLTLIVTTTVYVLVSTLTYRAWLGRSFITLPLAGLIDVSLLNYSMLKYEFANVAWKERNICLPVMHVVGHLPPLQ